VPWQLVADGEPRDVEPDPPIERTEMTDQQQTERLQALGYVE